MSDAAEADVADPAPTPPSAVELLTCDSPTPPPPLLCSTWPHCVPLPAKRSEGRGPEGSGRGGGGGEEEEDKDGDEGDGATALALFAPPPLPPLFERDLVMPPRKLPLVEMLVLSEGRPAEGADAAVVEVAAAFDEFLREDGVLNSLLFFFSSDVVVVALGDRAGAGVSDAADAAAPLR